MKSISKKNSNRVRKMVRKIPKFNSMQSIISISFAVFTITAILSISLILYNKLINTVEKNVLTSTEQVMEQVNVNLGYYFKGMNEVSTTFDDELNAIPISNGKYLSDILKMTVNLRKDIVSLAVFSKDGQILGSSSDSNLKKDLNIKNEEWFSGVVQQPDRLHFSLPHVQNLFVGKHSWVVSLSRETSYISNNKAVRGVSLVDLNFSAIDELCRKVNLGKRGYVYIVDKYGNIIYHPQQQLIYAGLKNENTRFVVSKDDGSYIENYDGEKTVVSIKTEKYTGWKVVGVSYYNEMLTTKTDLYYFFIIILAISFILVILISILISARITSPIKKLEKLMKQVEKGEFNIYAEEKGEDEIKHLSRTFNIMIRRIKELMDQNIKEQEEKRKSELKALQAQINPHFLYNTLDSIIWMSESNDNDGTIKMVTALASLFRIGISRGEELISIKDELQHARSYLIIQEIRYQDKFDFIIESNPDVLKYKTLKIIVQPIIENAIYHGIKPMVDKGLIKVTADIIDNKICIQVIDNGVGMSAEKLEKILIKDSKNKSGIGVKNVHQRIQLYFGSEYGLEYHSELDEGTCVKIWLPKQDDL